MSKINGIDVSEPVLTATNNNIYYSQNAVDELLNNIKRLQQELDIKEKMLDKFMIGSGETIEKLQEENEKIKKQYNCYACGNCNGKEDYIHLEIHHKGLRKQFDELVKENEELKKQLEFSRTHKTVLDAEKIKYKQALEEIKTYINQECENKQCPQTCANCFIGNILIKANEVLEDSEDENS